MKKTASILSRKIAADVDPWVQKQTIKTIPQSAFKDKINLNLSPVGDKKFVAALGGPSKEQIAAAEAKYKQKP